MAAFTCLDCGNSTTTSFKQGKCPACGSFNIKSPRSGKKEESVKRKTKKEIVLLLLLWGLIGAEFVRRYL
ncbi:MAG: hypothetical protein HRU20_25605 [Pseudomonadales bacterium]|nr:hypothetical protein [Pseudomonadales bacterium]